MRSIPARRSREGVVGSGMEFPVMNRIVRQHYPVEKLPAELREGMDPTVRVTIIIEPEPVGAEEPSLTLEDIFARRQPPYRTAADIDQDLSRLRDDWHD